VYLTYPGLRQYSRSHSNLTLFRFPGIFELTPIADAPDGAPSLILRLCLYEKALWCNSAVANIINHHKALRHSENTKQDKDVSVKKLRDSLETMQISVTVNSKSSEVEYADDVRRRAIGADVASEETKLAGSLFPQFFDLWHNLLTQNAFCLQVALHVSSPTTPLLTDRPRNTLKWSLLRMVRHRSFK